MKILRNFFLILFVCLALFAIERAVAAPERVGLVVAARGTVTNGTGHPLLQGSKVYQGDAITADKNSFVVIQLQDGAKLTIRPSSTIVIDTYNDSAGQISLLAGGLRVVSGTIAKTHPDNYKIKTPVALMGVRGTEFSLMLCDEKVCELEVK